MEIAHRNKQPCVIALGQFDSVHLGHKKIIADAVAEARRRNVNAAVFTFTGDVDSALNGLSGKGASVYSPEEREIVLRSLGADVVFSVEPAEVIDMSPEDFLAFLDEHFAVKGYFCGFDYRFGKNAAGDARFLENYAAEHGKYVCVREEVKDAYGKISTTRVKELLSAGDVAAANKLLAAGYFVTGKVVKERGVGRRIGFPTINLYPDYRKFPLKNAVYKGHVTLGDKVYGAIINYGARPTYGLDKPLVEAHLGGFAGNLYGETVSVCFDDFLREIKAFDSEDALKRQLRKDAEAIE